VREYEFKEIEEKWRKRWKELDLYRTPTDKSKPKFYCLDFFPYPSGDGLSVGHCRNYIPTDVISRYKRMKGFNVLHPMGWDAFGLPAENEAIMKGLHPMETVPRYVANYKRQLNLIGASYDWSREINSSHPEYYKWTQWFFLLLYKRGLAYRALAPVNWCPSCKTVLANEEVEGGRCWRCGSQVTKKELYQWFFKITSYADRLIEDLDLIDWPESIKQMQRNWIGRSEGLEFDMEVIGEHIPEGVYKIRVFTTRPDTVFGMSFAVIAPEHPLVRSITSPDRLGEVMGYVERAKERSEIERTAVDREKEGVFTGAYAVNPANGEKVPIFVADYVLMTYGTGAIMAVPAHDERDFEFAKRYNLPIPVVIAPPGWNGEELPAAYTGDGTMVNSGPFTGLHSKEGSDRISEWFEKMGIGQRKVHYKLRDWLISRQRYWGAPIPIIYCERCGEVPVPEEDLPVLLPKVERYQPSGTGRSPLATIPDFVETICPRCGGRAERETDTMGGFACSSWYFLRFASPHYDKGPFDPDEVNYWLPVDLYVGGAEHAVMHLLYARFWTKVMYDAGLVPFKEPFSKLMNQGMVLAPDPKEPGTWVKMSKSKGNVVTPDFVVEKYGADTLRVYELFVAPFDQTIYWTEEGLVGAFRFLNRVWRIVVDNISLFDRSWKDKIEDAWKTIPLDAPERALRRKLHQTIRKVSQDIEAFKFNTGIAALMEFVNHLSGFMESKRTGYWRIFFSEAVENLVLLLAPIAPFISEELWEMLGNDESVHTCSFPSWDEDVAKEEEITIVVQVDGKLRDRITLPASSSDEEIERAAISSERVKAFLGGKEIKKIVVVPKKLVNIVTEL